MLSGFIISIRKRFWGGTLKTATTTLRKGRLSLPSQSSPLIQFPSAVSVTLGQLKSENSRNKQFLSFRLHATLSSMMESHTDPHRPARETDRPCPGRPPCRRRPPVGHLVAVSVIRLIVEVAQCLHSSHPYLLNNATCTCLLLRCVVMIDQFFMRYCG